MTSETTETRKCIKCGRELPISAFRVDADKKTGRRYTCKECVNAYERERVANKKRECVAFKGNQCALCGIKYNGSNLHIFEFHHIKNDKLFDISARNANMKSVDVRNELTKCILVCSNCHKRIHSMDD